MATRSLVLLSGGVDSAVVYRQTSNALALFVDYNQPAAEQEYRAARDLTWGCGNLIEARVKIPLGDMVDPVGQAGPLVVPGRNAVLISLGISYAMAKGCQEVLLGAHHDDRTDYPDCRPSFVTAANMMAAAYGVTVRAPLMGLSKASILKEAARLGIDTSRCWSCYTPDRNGNDCGTCNSCRAAAS